MTDHELEARLSQAVRHAAPNDLDGILSRCKDRKGNVIPMTETTVKKNRKVLPWLAAAACLLLAIGFGFQYQQMNAVASVVSLDVNPSVVLSVNNKEKVLEARAANLDAEEILEGMDLKGTDLNVAINAIVGSLLKHGYVDELANSILITVEDDDAARGSALQAALTTEVNDILTSASVHAAILSQTVGTDDAALQEKADQYGITLGKATLIQSMVDQNSQLTFEELAPLSVNELNLLASNPKNEPTAVTSTGAASDEAYIGVEGAKEAAFAHAGLSASEVSMGEVDFDYEDGRMVYELEFYAGGREYEYDVDASTGAIVKSSYEGGRAPSQAPAVPRRPSGVLLGLPLPAGPVRHPACSVHPAPASRSSPGPLPLPGFPAPPQSVPAYFPSTGAPVYHTRPYPGWTHTRPASAGRHIPPPASADPLPPGSPIHWHSSPGSC